jgi:hypothetical protein
MMSDYHLSRETGGFPRNLFCQRETGKQFVDGHIGAAKQESRIIPGFCQPKRCKKFQV